MRISAHCAASARGTIEAARHGLGRAPAPKKSAGEVQTVPAQNAATSAKFRPPRIVRLRRAVFCGPAANPSADDRRAGGPPASPGHGGAAAPVKRKESRSERSKGADEYVFARYGLRRRRGPALSAAGASVRLAVPVWPALLTLFRGRGHRKRAESICARDLTPLRGEKRAESGGKTSGKGGSVVV